MEKDILRYYAAAYFPPKSVVEFPVRLCSVIHIHQCVLFGTHSLIVITFQLISVDFNMCNQISITTAIGWYQDASGRLSSPSSVTTKTSRLHYESIDEVMTFRS